MAFAAHCNDASSTAELTAEQALNRKWLLEELSSYCRRGRFPLNEGQSKTPLPIFIDRQGARCAVAHLMEISGLKSLVQHIAQTDNFATVHELSRFPQLRAWLKASGLSLQEAACIQPTYCFISQAQECFCNNSAESSVAVATVLGVESQSILLRVDRIEGESRSLSLGQELTIVGQAEEGSQVFLGQNRFDETEQWEVYRAGGSLTAVDGEVRCTLSDETFRRPVPVETAIEALSAEPAQCVEVLATDNSGWNRSQCDGVEQSFNSESSGCSLSPTGALTDAALDATGITSATLFVALLALRRRRDV